MRKETHSTFVDFNYVKNLISQLIKKISFEVQLQYLQELCRIFPVAKLVSAHVERKGFGHVRPRHPSGIEA